MADARPVWDVVVRATHWALAAIVVFELVRDDGDFLHRVVGYAGVALVAVRLAWSLRPRRHSSLVALRPSLRATSTYVRRLAHGEPTRSVGHDPLGVWMIWLLWTLVLLLGLTGWMSRLDAFWGDDRVHDAHAWLANALLVAVVVHVLAVIVMSRLWRENLPLSMITGRKRLDD